MNVDKACAVLDLNLDALDMESVGRQYRKLSLKYHPDKRRGTIEQFRQLSEAKLFLETYLDEELDNEDEFAFRYDAAGGFYTQYQQRMCGFLETVLGRELQQYVWEKLTLVCREQAVVWATSLDRKVLSSK